MKGRCIENKTGCHILSGDGTQVCLVNALVCEAACILLIHCTIEEFNGKTCSDSFGEQKRETCTYEHVRNFFKSCMHFNYYKPSSEEELCVM